MKCIFTGKAAVDANLSANLRGVLPRNADILPAVQASAKIWLPETMGSTPLLCAGRPYSAYIRFGYNACQ